MDQKVARLGGERPWAVLLADLDRFKQINDTLGHRGGDQLIQEVSTRFQSLVGPDDIVARFGGDEFAILLYDRSSRAEIEELVEAMVAAIRESFIISDTSVFIGVSIGIACVFGYGGDRSELMRMADVAMYRAKADGRDGFRFFIQDMDENVKLRREIALGPEKALTPDRLPVLP